MLITKNTSIEEIVNFSAAAVRFLSQKGIKCIACGEPVWGTLEEAALEKGFNQKDIDRFVTELNNL